MCLAIIFLRRHRKRNAPLDPLNNQVPTSGHWLVGAAEIHGKSVPTEMNGSSRPLEMNGESAPAELENK